MYKIVFVQRTIKSRSTLRYSSLGAGKEREPPLSSHEVEEGGFN